MEKDPGSCVVHFVLVCRPIDLQLRKLPREKFGTFARGASAFARLVFQSGGQCTPQSSLCHRPTGSTSLKQLVSPPVPSTVISHSLSYHHLEPVHEALTSLQTLLITLIFLNYYSQRHDFSNTQNGPIFCLSLKGNGTPNGPSASWKIS